MRSAGNRGMLRPITSGDSVMLRWISGQKVLWVASGLIVGLVLGATLPHSPVHATATSQQEQILIATGPVDSDGEAVFVLNGQEGILYAWVICPGAGFNAYQHAVGADFGAPANAKYVMVTGAQNFKPRAGGATFANCVVFVGELTTGKLVSYTLPWNIAQRTRPQGTGGAFIKGAEFQFARVPRREE